MTRAGGLVLSAVVDPSGTATALWTVAPSRGFTVTGLAASGTGLGVTGEARVYVNSVLVDATAAAANDVSDTTFALVMGDQVRVDWAKCAPGARVSVTLNGDV